MSVIRLDTVIASEAKQSSFSEACTEAWIASSLPDTFAAHKAYGEVVG